MAIQPQHISVNDAATWLGVSRKTVERRISSGQLPVVRLGRRVLINKDDLHEFLGHRVGPEGLATHAERTAYTLGMQAGGAA